TRLQARTNLADRLRGRRARASPLLALTGHRQKIKGCSMKNAHKWKRWVSVAGVVGLVLVTMRWHSSVVSQPIAKSDAATVVDLGRATCSEKFTAIEDNGRML